MKERKISLVEVQRSLASHGYKKTLSWTTSKVDFDGAKLVFPKTLEFINVDEKKDTAEAIATSGGSNVDNYSQAMLDIMTGVKRAINTARQSNPDDCATVDSNGKKITSKLVFLGADGTTRYQFQNCFWDFDKRQKNAERRLKNNTTPTE